jgi:hypothetical protein
MRTMATGIFLIAGALSLPAAPQGGNPKQEIERQLQSRYVPVKLGPRGQNVVTPGTILTVLKPGIRSNPATQFTFMNNYQDGRIKYSVGSSIITDKKNIRDLQVGENVYLYKVEVKDNGVVFHVQPCGNCDFSMVDPSPFRAGITFQFPKGWLESTGTDQIDQTISQVFTIAGFSGTPPTMAAPAPPSDAMQPAPPLPVPQRTPPTIELGQSPEQVLAALGQPEKVVDLGNKKIFVYRDLKITFIDGKVADVQ